MTLTIDQILEKEPCLLFIVDWVKAENERAKESEIYWCEFWYSLKKRLNPYIGWHCGNPELWDSATWDLFTNYLESLTPNMK